jgi:hypothetical protein
MHWYDGRFKKALCSPGGVAQWTSHLPQQQKTWVRIKTGYKGKFWGNQAILLFTID